jgi:hypothetical protein
MKVTLASNDLGSLEIEGYELYNLHRGNQKNN